MLVNGKPGIFFGKLPKLILVRTIYRSQNPLHTKLHENLWIHFRGSNYIYTRIAHLKIFAYDQCYAHKHYIV